MLDYFSGFITDGVPHVDDLADWQPMTDCTYHFMHFRDNPCEMIQPPVEHLIQVQQRGKPFPGM